MEKVVLATVGSVEITKDQMIGILRNIPKEHAQSVAGHEGRLRLLDEMIAGEVLYLDSMEAGLDQEEEFLAIVDEAKRGLLQRYAVNKMFSDLQVSQEDVEKFYNENKEQFAEQAKVSAKHILVDNEELCQQVLSEIQAGKEFDEAAKEYSSCPSKERGGDLGAFSKGQMVKEFEEAAFSAEVGSLVGPVKTQFGYHLIYVQDKIDGEEKSLDEVAPMISSQLMQMKQSEVYSNKVEGLKEKYPIKVFPELLK